MSKLSIFDFQKYISIKAKIDSLERRILTLGLNDKAEKRIINQIVRLENTIWIKQVEHTIN